MAQYKTGIALGGGGARGFAHLGVLKALEEKNIRPDIISGVSAGSLVGVFLASDKSPDEIMNLMKENKITDYAQVTMPINGLMDLGNLEDILKEHIEVRQIEALKIPFYITVSNLYEGEVEYINKGPIIPFVQASASIPVLFAPVTINDTLYVDGGLMDNLPVAPLKNCCDKTIAISISPVQRVKQLDNLIAIAARTFQLSVNDHKGDIEANCDVFIEPPGLEKYGILDTTHADELFEIGYEYTSKMDFEGF